MQTQVSFTLPRQLSTEEKAQLDAGIQAVVSEILAGGSKPVEHHSPRHRRPLLLPEGCAYDSATDRVYLARHPEAWAIPGHWFTLGGAGPDMKDEVKSGPAPGYDPALEGDLPAHEVGHGCDDRPEFTVPHWARYRAMIIDLKGIGLSAEAAAAEVWRLFEQYRVHL